MKNSFEKKWEKEVPEINSKAVFYSHIKTKAEVLFLINKNEENKTFGIGFKTLPQDSTGVAHILEHCVLSGSKKYPVKDPFVILLKTSLKTFLNAITYSDKTLYPVSSKNDADFYNLKDVYLDTVFNPLLDKKSFMQEGWHYEIENTDSELKYKGVVYNEMKGVATSLDRIIDKEVQTNLYSTSIYKNDSGGEPSEITRLTYEQFVDFHKKFYHPSNSRTFYHGNVDIQKELSHLEEYFSSYDYKKPEKIELTKPFNESKNIQVKYAFDKNNKSKEKYAYSISWSLPFELSKETAAAVDVLGCYLVESENSPLKREIIEKGLAGSLIEFGFDPHTKQPIFTIGAKQIKKENIEKVKNALEKVVENLSKNPDVKNLEAVINKIEFSKREGSGSSYYTPGVEYFTTAMERWNYDQDPLFFIEFEKTFKKLRKDLQNGGKLFQKVLKDYFVENKFRVNISYEPDTKFVEKREKKEKEKLKRIKESLSKQDIVNIKNKTKEIALWQGTPDPVENRNKLPQLKLSDIERKVETIPTHFFHHNGFEVLHTNLKTNEIVYVDLVFDISKMEPYLYKYLSLFSKSLTRTPTKNLSHNEVAFRIDRDFGDISIKPFFETKVESKEMVSKLIISAKYLAKNSDDALNLIFEILNGAHFPAKRIEEILTEMSASMENGLTRDGHIYALYSSLGSIDPITSIKEDLKGISQFMFLKELKTNWANSSKETCENLGKILAHLQSTKPIIHLTLPEEKVNKNSEEIEKVLNKVTKLEEKLQVRETGKSTIDEKKRKSAFKATTSVNYVATAIKYHEKPKISGGEKLVILNFLKNEYLWEKIRVSGGAYGAIVFGNTNSQYIAFSSYRDPNIEKTFEVYNQTAEYLKKVKVSKRELEGIIISTIGKLEPYKDTQEKSDKSLNNFLLDLNTKKRQEWKDQVISFDADSLKKFSQVLQDPEDKSLAVIGEETKIDKLKKADPQFHIQNLA